MSGHSFQICGFRAVSSVILLSVQIILALKKMKLCGYAAFIYYFSSVGIRFFFFLATPLVCRSSWARDGTRATAVTMLDP